MNARMFGLPIDSPLETEPDAGMVEAGEMWRIALLHVGVLGGWDRRIVAWLLDTWDAGTIATVAAWLRRAWQEGVKAGRREVLGEAGDLRAELDRVTAQLDTLTADVRKVAADLAKVAVPVVEGQVGALDGDRLLAAVDAAVVDLGDAVEHLADPPACPQCSPPQCGRCPADVLDAVRGFDGTDPDVCEGCGHPLCEHGDAGCAHPMPAGGVCDCTSDEDPDDECAVCAVACGAEADDGTGDVLQPGYAIPDMPGFVVGVCGHRVAGSEWAAGFRTCERCPADDGHSTPLAAAGLASCVLGVASLVAALSGSPVLGFVLGTVGGLTGAVVTVLGRRGRDGGAS